MTTCPLIKVSFRTFALAGVLACVVTALAPAPVYAQGPLLNLNQLDRLASRAKETVNVSLDQSMLQSASGFFSGQPNTDNDAFKQLLSGLKGVYVRTFEFDTDNAYTEADLDSVRSQLKAPWSRMVSVRERAESVDVYMWPEGDHSGGMAILVADRRELVVVNIVGTINLSQLAALGGKLGVPGGLDQLGLGGAGNPPPPPSRGAQPQPAPRAAPQRGAPPAPPAPTAPPPPPGQ